MGDRVFINGRAAVHAGSAGKSIAFPDVCLCPPTPPAGPIPTPLVNTAKAADLDGCAATVTIEGNRVAHAQSFVARSTGNEVAQSTGGGIITHTTQGKAFFQTFSMDVMICGQPAVRHLDLLTHNHVARMPGNTPPAPWLSTMDPTSPSAQPKTAEKQLREGKEWIEVEMLDVEGQPVPYEACKLTTPAGEIVEGRSLFAGGFKIRGLSKGNCQISFPGFDAGLSSRGRKASDTIPVPSHPGKKSNADKVYVPGKPLALATGKKYTLELPVGPSFWLELTVRRRRASPQSCAYVLRSKNGSYEVRRTLADDLKRNQGAVVLQFPDLAPDQLYTLSHYPDAKRSPRILFKDVPYDKLRGRAVDTKAQRPKAKRLVDDIPDELRRKQLEDLNRQLSSATDSLPDVEEPE